MTLTNLPKLLTFLLLATSLLAQTPTLTLTAPATVKRASTFTLNVVLTNVGIATQWTLNVPTGWTVQAKGTPSFNGKQVDCSTTLTKCVVYGFDFAAIPNGGTIPFTVRVPSTAALGNANIMLTNTLGVNTSLAVVVTTGGNATIAVQPDIRDLNGDGIIDALDGISAMMQALGDQPCTNGDVTLPVGCDVIDVQVIMLKAKGQID